MVEVSITELVSAPQGVAFDFLSDFEKAPRYSHLWRSTKVISRQGNTTIYEVVAEVMGRKMNSVAKITTYPTDRIEAETIEGDGKGTMLSFRLQGTSNGTQVTLEGNVVLPGFAKFLGSAVKGRIESSMKEEMEAIKKALQQN